MSLAIPASIGPAQLVAKDNVKPGISRLFPLRLSLRVGEMIRSIRRGGLPGVVRTDQVKTVGCREWKGCGDVVRLMTPAASCDYGRLAAHALKTLLEGSKGRSSQKMTEDVDVVAGLRTTAPPLSEDYVQKALSDRQDVMAACRARMKQSRRAAAKPKGRVPVSAVPSEPPVPQEDVSSGSAVAVMPEAVGVVEVAVVDVAEEAPQRSLSSQSLESSSSAAVSDGGDVAADDTVSEADSRDVDTDDSWDETSAAVTDPFGFSPRMPSDTGDSEEDDSGPSAGCTSGED